MLKNNTARLVLRRIILAAAVTAAALIQNSAGGALSKYNIGVFLLIPLTVSIGMFEKEFAGMFFGIFAGALWDLCSPAADGVYALFFAFTTFLCGLLTHYVLRNSVKSAAVITAAVFAAFAAVSLIFNCLAKDPSGAEFYIKSFIPRSLAATALTLPPAYYAVSLVHKRFRPENSFTAQRD